jgi:hypothetical protein
MALPPRKADPAVIKIHLEPMSDELRMRYEENVRIPGQRWLEAHPVVEPKAGEPAPKKQRPPSYWREIQPDLARAFHRRCAYTAMWINYDGEVDHAVSVEEDRTKAYDWDNFRYCVGWFNSKKQDARSHQLLDPLLVEDDWFEVSVPDLQLRMTEKCPEHLRSQAEFMLEDLELRNGEKVMLNRETYWNLYEEEGEAALRFIEREAPLVARAIRKDLAQRPAAQS